MNITKKNMARLASISALGAGALGVAAGTAEADTVHYTPLTGKVGWAPGDTSAFAVPASCGGFSFQRRYGVPGWVYGHYWYYDRWGIKMFASLPAQIDPAGPIAAGATWNGAGGLASQQLAFHRYLRNSAGHIWENSFARTGGTSSQSGDFYKLFTFQPGTTTLFGWVELNLSWNGGLNNGPELLVEGIAYDDSGARLGAGVTTGSSSGVPEPSTAIPASVAALAFGAAGLRRWRAARTGA